MKITKDLKILLDLYNLQIHPDLSLEKSENLLNKTELRKLKIFIEDHSETKIEHGIDVLVGWGFHDYWAFLSDYLMVQHIIDEYLDDYRLNKKCCDWIFALWRNLQQRPAFTLAPKPAFTLAFKASPKSGDTKWDQNQYWDLNHFEVIDKTESSIHHFWHGLSIHKVGVAIVKGLSEILSGKDVFQRCRLESCEKIFRPSDRGYEQKFCSASCRAKSSRQSLDATANSQSSISSNVMQITA